MNIEELIELSKKPEAPFNRDEYTIWLHNKIIDKIQYELWEYRESKPTDIKNYVSCNHIFKLKSLQRAKP